MGLICLNSNQILKELYYISKYGYISHAQYKKIGEPFYLDSLYGKLSFWKLIEPDNQYVYQAIDKVKAIKIKI